MTMQQTLDSIQPADVGAAQAARARLDGMAKPLHGLGLLEDAICTLAGAQGTPDVCIDRRAVVVFCADNGVVAQGVTQCGQEVTAAVTENLSRGDATVCHMARAARAEVIPVDIGVARPVTGERILQRNILRGTADMTQAPAMSKSDCVRAIEAGIALASELKAQGFGLLLAGEMGIGNTTTSAAVASVLLDLPPETVTGRGAGLSTKGLQKKLQSIKNAINLHQPSKNDPLGVIAAVGGLDIAGLTGLHLGGAACGLPVLLDGVISAVAALTAAQLCPSAKGYMLSSHVSAEPTGARILDALGLPPLICAGLHLGEGTGAVAGVALLDLALAAYRGMARFEELGLAPYQPQV